MHDIIKSNHFSNGGDTNRKTFVQAIEEKYVNQEEIEGNLIVPKDNAITTEITFVGFGKVSSVQRKLNQLISLDLSNRNINSLGNLEKLDGSLGRLQLLNLANNLLTWNDVINLLLRIPNIREIIISNNDLVSDMNSIKFPDMPTKTLKSMIIGHTYLNWTDIIRILSSFILQVHELDLWSSRLSTDKMELKSEGLKSFVKNIESLKLSHNEFVDISWLEKVGPLDNLMELHLSNCGLRSFKISKQIAELIRNIEFFDISHNEIQDWHCVSTLNRLTKLRHVICHDNPFYSKEKFSKYLIIGRLSKLNIINREEISIDLRRDSEIFYLRKGIAEYEQYKRHRDSNFEPAYSRYEELIERYGMPANPETAQSVEKYMNVELCFRDQKLLKKLPCDMRVSNLRLLCKRLFKIDSSDIIQITCSDPSDGALSYVLDQDSQTLHFFSVRSGQQLIVTNTE